MNKPLSVRDLTLIGLLTALVAVATMIIKVPIPATQGYIHLGDSMIFLAAILFGRRHGAVAAGLGSALADILLGYTAYALPTLIIKGLMGYMVGVIAEQQSESLLNIRNIIAMIVGAVWMASGYLATATIMYGDFTAALVGGFPSDLLQGFGGAVLFIPLGIALKKSSFYKDYVLK